MSIRPTDCDAALMNARIREKKKQLKEGRKPETLSGWVCLSQEMIQWFKDNPTIRNFLTYGDRHGYTWSQFKRWRRESEIFSQAIETCVQICLERREEYLDKEKKLSAIFLREQPIYNPMLYDYEMEKSAKEGDALINAAKQIPLWQGAKAMRIEEKEKIKKEKK